MCSATSSEVHLADVQVTKPGRSGSRPRSSSINNISNSDDTASHCGDSAFLAAGNRDVIPGGQGRMAGNRGVERGGSTSSSSSKGKQNSGGDNEAGADVSGKMSTITYASSLSTPSPPMWTQQQQQQQQPWQQSRPASVLAAEAEASGHSSIPDSERGASIARLRQAQQQSATALDTGGNIGGFTQSRHDNQRLHCKSPGLDYRRDSGKQRAGAFAPVAAVRSPRPHSVAADNNDHRRYPQLHGTATYHIHPISRQPPQSLLPMAFGAGGLASHTSAGVGDLAADPACKASAPSLYALSQSSGLAVHLASSHQSARTHYSVNNLLPQSDGLEAQELLTRKRTSVAAGCPAGSTDVDMDMGMDADVGMDAGVGIDAGVGNSARTNENQGALVSAADAAGSSWQAPPPMHGHSLLDSQLSPIKSLTALSLSQQAPHPQQQQGERDEDLASVQSKIADIQRCCQSLMQVQAQQAAQISSLEAAVRRLSDAASPLPGHQRLTPIAGSVAHVPPTAGSPPPVFHPSAPGMAAAPRYPAGDQQRRQHRVVPPPTLAQFGVDSFSQASSSSLQQFHQPQAHLPHIQAKMAPLTPRARTSSDCATGSDCAPVTDALALQAHRRPSLASDVYAASAAYGRGGEQHHSRQFSATAHAYGHPQPFPAPAQDAVRSGPQLLSPKKPRRLSPAAQTGQPLQLQTRRGSAVRVQPQLLAPAALAYAPATSAYAPAASAYAPASSASSDSMGAIQAVGLAGMRLKRVRDTEPAPSSSSSSLQQQQLNPVKPNLVQPNLVSPNPAQPTQAWLSTQRVYKVALHRLLTLESFYPSDAAMLNAFRAQGDFSSAQIEAHGAALLSWARSWLRYSRNAMLRSTLDNKARAPLPQLAEALQHDLHSEVDFTTPANLRRCALLRLIYFQWQALNKLGTKSQSMYRDYEARLREIDALPTPADQEREWRAIVDEEQTRRLEIIREARAKGEPSSGSPSRNLISAAALNPLPPPTPSRSQISAAANPPPLPPAPAPAPPAPGPSFYRFQQQPPLPYHGPPLPPPSQLHRHHHRQPQSPPPPPPPPLQLSRQHGYHTYHHQHPQHLQFHEGASGAHASAGFDNDSEMSVHMSPEP